MSDRAYIDRIPQRSSATLNVYRYKGGISPEELAIPITPQSVRRFRLMSEDSITLVFSLAVPIRFELGDYLVDPIFGTFYITEEQMPRYNQQTGGYDYSLRFDADYMRWKRLVFMLVASVYDEDEEDYVDRRMETDWKLTAPLAVHAEQIVANLNIARYSGYLVSVTADNAAEVKFLQYSGVDIIEALGMIAEAWGCEWWVDDKVIHFGKCELDSTPYVFAIGDNVESMEVARDQQTYANRIYAYGGTQNIPEDYDRELVFTVTEYDSGTKEFQDSARPLSLGMIEGDIEATSVTFTMSNIYSKVGQTYSQSTDLKRLNGGQTIQASVAVSLSFESDNEFIGNTELATPTISASIYVKAGDNKTLVKTISNIVPGGKIDGSDGYSRVWYLNDSFTHALNLSAETQVAVIVEWQVSYNQPNNVHQNDTVSCADEGSIIKAVEDASNGSKAVNVYLYGNTTARPAKFSGRTGKIKFNGTAPSGWKVGTKYTLSPLTLKVPLYYYTPLYDTGGIGKVGERRLHLPGTNRYRDAETHIVEDSIVEMAVIFPDEYPRLDLRIKAGSIGTKEMEDTINHDDGSVSYEKWTQYSFSAEYSADGGQTWSNFNFDLGWMLDGQTLEAAFTTPATQQSSGFQLAGMKFKVGFSNNRYTIIRNDEYGASLPNDILRPSDHDTFFLIGWNPRAMSQMNIVTQAQNRLRTRTDAYLAAIKAGQFTFTCKMMSNVFFTSAYGGHSDKSFGLIRAGAKVTVSHPALAGGSKDSRVIGYEYKLDMPFDTPTYTIGDTEAYSRLKQIEKQLQRL